MDRARCGGSPTQFGDSFLPAPVVRNAECVAESQISLQYTSILAETSCEICNI